MNSSLASHFLVCIILAVVSVPLILKRIPPNRIYGVRTAKTLRDAATWYKVNWFGGWAILIASLSGALTLVIVAQYLPQWLVHAGLLTMAPLIVALAAIWLYAVRIADAPSNK